MGLFQRRGSRRPARYAKRWGEAHSFWACDGSPHATLEVLRLAVIRTRCATRALLPASVLTTLAQARTLFFARIAHTSPLLHCQVARRVVLRDHDSDTHCRQKRAPKKPSRLQEACAIPKGIATARRQTPSRWPGCPAHRQQQPRPSFRTARPSMPRPCLQTPITP